MITPSAHKNKPLGRILQEADLLSSPQIELALKDQAIFKHLRFGEILALRGWIKQETADFFVEEWPKLLAQANSKRLPIGHYLKAAGLLNQKQIDDILFDQELLGTKFGSTAIFKGWIKQKTIKFFLENLHYQAKKEDFWVQVEYTDDIVTQVPETPGIVYAGEPYITLTATDMPLSSEVDFEWIEV